MGARRGCAPLPPNFNPMTLMDGYMRIFSPGAIGPTLTKTDSPSEWTVRRLHGYLEFFVADRLLLPRGPRCIGVSCQPISKVTCQLFVSL